MQEYLDSVLLGLLEAGGVDNWEWYSESLEDAGITDDSTDSEILAALLDGGVNGGWEWYGDSIEGFSGYEDHVRAQVNAGDDYVSFDEWMEK